MFCYISILFQLFLIWVVNLPNKFLTNFISGIIYRYVIYYYYYMSVKIYDIYLLFHLSLDAEIRVIQTVDNSHLVL